jgi:hypothetical protein
METEGKADPEKIKLSERESKGEGFCNPKLDLA